MSVTTEPHVGVLIASPIVAHAQRQVATARAVLNALGSEPLSLAMIVWLVDRPRETVRRHLLALHEAELAVRLPHGEWIAAWASDDVDGPEVLPSTSRAERCGICRTVLTPRGICPNTQCPGATS